VTLGSAVGVNHPQKRENPGSSTWVTWGFAGALGGIRTPNLLIRRSLQTRSPTLRRPVGSRSKVPTEAHRQPPLGYDWGTDSPCQPLTDLGRSETRPPDIDDCGCASCSAA
jgi:hypothetical protein